MSGWVDLNSEKQPRPSSSVVLDMSTGQPHLPRDLVAEFYGITTIGERIYIKSATRVTKGTIGYDSVTDQFRFISQDTTNMRLSGNANTVIIDGGGQLADDHVGLTRAIDTVYQNTSDYLKLVMVTIDVENGTEIILYMDAATPPTTARLRAENQGGAWARIPMTFIVPNDYYYKITTASATKIDWTEIDLYGDPT